MKHRVDFVSVYSIHNEDLIGAQVLQGARLDNFVTSSRDEVARFSRVEVDYMRDDVAGWIDHI